MKCQKCTKIAVNTKGIEMDLEKYIDKKILNKFEFYNYGHA